MSDAPLILRLSIAGAPSPLWEINIGPLESLESLEVEVMRKDGTKQLYAGLLLPLKLTEVFGSISGSGNRK